MRLRLLACLLLAASLDAAAADLYAEVNRLRAGQGGCTAKSLPPLKPQAALERTAQEASRGADLPQSLKASGYRATLSRIIILQGEGVAAGTAGLLASRHCTELQDA